VLSDPESADDEIIDEYRWNLLYRKKQELRIIAAFELFRLHGIEPVLIKGWAIGSYYPPSICRTASDTDLAVHSYDHETAEAIRTSPEGRKLIIDLHNGVRRHDTVPFETLFERAETVTLGGTAIRILRPEDHLRVVVSHWLTDGAEYKDKLWDIYYMIQNRPENFDWDLCLKPVSKHRQRWIEAAAGLASKYLGLELSETPFPNAADSLPEWLIECVEREWATELRLVPLDTLFRDPAQFIRQVKKRIPPNPIASVIDCDGDLYSERIAWSQTRSFFRRFIPSAAHAAHIFVSHGR